jgi:hypothetical protein
MRGARTRPLLLCALACTLGLMACGDDTDVLPGDPDFYRDPSLDVPNRSAAEDGRSHNMGLNCMGCHQAHGPGRGRFSIGLTVFGPDRRPFPNPILELFAAPPDSGAAALYRFEGDRLGNVFTTDEMPFPDRALFVRVRSADGKLRRQMPFPTLSGACNQCHRPGFEVQLEMAK